MTNDQKKEIIAYLQGIRDHGEGVALYQKYGVNLRLKRQFTIDQSAAVHEILIDELRKLAGLTTAQLLRLPRLAKSAPATVPVTPDTPITEMESTGKTQAEVPETMRKMIRFRERYTFLNSPDCPDVLKVLVADMFTAYGEYKSAFARLQALGDEDSANAAAECEKVVTEYLKNREIWDELEYYREHGTILGKAAKFREMEAAEDLTLLSDVEIMAKLQSAKVQESKTRKKVEKLKSQGADFEAAAVALDKWTTRKAQLKAEVERRKKK